MERLTRPQGMQGEKKREGAKSRDARLRVSLSRAKPNYVILTGVASVKENKPAKENKGDSM